MSEPNDNTSDIERRKNAYRKHVRKAMAEGTLSPPVVVGPTLREPFLPSFGDFIQLPDTRKQFGMDNDTAELLSRLVQDRDFMLLSTSKHPDNKEKARRLLADFVRRAYLGDQRGLLYWRRVSKVIWVAYENHLQLQRWAARVKSWEDERIARWQARVEKEAERLRNRGSKPSLTDTESSQVAA